MKPTQTIAPLTLRNWLETKQAVNIVDIRPVKERLEWFIPGSIHIDAYDKLKADDQTAMDALDGLSLNTDIPLVAVCAAGKTSIKAAGLLQKKGYNAYSLEGGMKGWTLSWNTAKLSFKDFDILQIRRTGKGCLSYIIISGYESIIVDASLPVEVYEEFLRQHDLGLKYVIETHIHADHLSRSKRLAENNNVPLYLPLPNKVQFEFQPIAPDQVFHLGNIAIKTLQTPGHTMESTSFLIDDRVLLTGDTLFTNGVGRPDLKSTTEETTKKARLLYQSLQKILALDEHIIVLPAHTSQPVDFDSKPIRATLSSIKMNVPLLKLNETDFIKTLLERIPPTPANYLSIVESNISGSVDNINSIELEAGANRCAVS
jgi:glyoxylase-like metal-dependent hydrolase (beta-lactamase superfamily II)/rhodanese-related sulfurtransferase